MKARWPNAVGLFTVYVFAKMYSQKTAQYQKNHRNVADNKKKS